MQITINLCSTPYVNVEPLIRKLRIAVYCLAGLILCAGTLLGFMHFRNASFQREERAIDSAIVRQSDELASYRKMLLSPENVGIANRALALNSVFSEKSFSWTMLLKDFEGLMPAEVQLATIQPLREKDGSISIHMHVIGPHAKVIELVQGMESSKSFRQPVVTSEMAHSDARPNQHATPLSASSAEEFDIQAAYEEDSPESAKPDAAAPGREPAGSVAATTLPARVVSGKPSANLISSAVHAEGTR